MKKEKRNRGGVMIYSLIINSLSIQNTPLVSIALRQHSLFYSGGFNFTSLPKGMVEDMCLETEFGSESSQSFFQTAIYVLKSII